MHGGNNNYDRLLMSIIMNCEVWCVCARLRDVHVCVSAKVTPGEQHSLFNQLAEVTFKSIILTISAKYKVKTKPCKSNSEKDEEI